MTLMFCAFDGEAKILRVYGHSLVTHPYETEWSDKIAKFPELAEEVIGIAGGIAYLPFFKHGGGFCPNVFMILISWYIYSSSKIPVGKPSILR